MDKNIHILVVDDFATMRQIVRRSLRSIGYSNVDEAVDGVDALNKLQEGQFNLIISDWNMPNMMGLDLLKAVRASDKFKALPFLMVTAEADLDNITEAAKAGVSQYIVKPFTVESLEDKLNAIARRMKAAATT